jgi:hypothetical protein
MILYTKILAGDARVLEEPIKQKSIKTKIIIDQLLTHLKEQLRIHGLGQVLMTHRNGYVDHRLLLLGDSFTR